MYMVTYISTKPLLLYLLSHHRRQRLPMQYLCVPVYTYLVILHIVLCILILLFVHFLSM